MRNRFSGWLESMGQDPRTFLKDVVVFIIRYLVVLFIVFLPITILTYILQPATPALSATPTPATPAPLPSFWLIMVPLGIYLFLAVSITIALVGCWYKLAGLFPAHPNFKDGELFKWQSAGVGVSSYNRVLTIRVAPQGLYLACNFPFRIMHSPMLIPWSQIVAVRDKRFLGRAATYLTIGSPKLATITLDNKKVIDAARQWLPSA